ncbi:MAG TPA: glycogen debranching protein [Verrucomicrobiales bacterium]|nr:glycogen debranching protein [Verrucomicrobiales bacterium]
MTSSVSNSTSSRDREWLEADGRGGFAMGTAGLVRTRRYHGLLLFATTPPTGRIMLVNGFDAWLETPAGNFPLSAQVYAPDVLHPDGSEFVESFDHEPWPRWAFALPDGNRVGFELFSAGGGPVTHLTWRRLAGSGPAKLCVRPFLSGRDYHSLHRANGAFRFDAANEGQFVRWRPYDGLPGIVALHNGRYRSEPHWFHNFQYEEERARGLDHIEDLGAPGVFEFDLGGAEAVLVFTTDCHASQVFPDEVNPTGYLHAVRERERQSRQLKSPLDRAVDAYLVHGRHGKTIIAGYPWFADWGRDTFIALRGLCLANGRLADAEEILLTWSRAVDQGMLPNRFPDQGEQPEFNAVDASLWFVVAVHEHLEAADRAGRKVPNTVRALLSQAVQEILEGYSRGTRFGIRMDADCLLACGEPGVQLTWMDAKVGDWVVTPRIGKPVEVQALWLNGLWIGARQDRKWEARFEHGLASFRERFWNPATSGLFDVIDADHRAGNNDGTIRPNQIFAVGGLPLNLLGDDAARAMLQIVESRLLTPLGLRSLAPDDPAYCPHYRGGVRERDGAYHQGTVWPWLIGPFVEAWLRVNGDTKSNRRVARERFLTPLLEHLGGAGLAHVSEVADADSPHTPGGCPFQAWSLGELLRLDRQVLAEPVGGTSSRRKPRRQPATA